MGKQPDKVKNTLTRKKYKNMKLSIFTIAAISLVEGKEKKVPPRTPPKRLATLRRFADEWTSANMADADLASKWANKLKKHADRMEKKIQSMRIFRLFFETRRTSTSWYVQKL